MPLVVVGVLMLLAHLADFGPFGTWPWWVFALPFAGAVLWWNFADNSGWTQRRVMEKMERKKVARREKAMEALGLSSSRERLATRSRKDAARRSTVEQTKHEDRPAQPPSPAAPPPAPVRRDPRL